MINYVLKEWLFLFWVAKHVHVTHTTVEGFNLKLRPVTLHFTERLNGFNRNDRRHVYSGFYLKMCVISWLIK